MDVTTWFTQYWEFTTKQHGQHPNTRAIFTLTQAAITTEGGELLFFPVVKWGSSQPDLTKSRLLFWLVFRTDNHNLQIKHQTLRGNAPNEYFLKLLWNEDLLPHLLAYKRRLCIANTFEMRVVYWDKRQSEIKHRHFRLIKAEYLISKS